MERRIVQGYTVQPLSIVPVCPAMQSKVSIGFNQIKTAGQRALSGARIVRVLKQRVFNLRYCVWREISGSPLLPMDPCALLLFLSWHYQM